MIYMKFVLFCLIVLVPTAYNQVTYPNDQSNFTYGNQYNQYPGGNQYPSPGGAPYPGNQYHPQYNADGQVMTSVVWSSFISKNIQKKTLYGISIWTQYFRKRATNIKKRFLTLLWLVTCSFCNRFTFLSSNKYYFFYFNILLSRTSVLRLHSLGLCLLLWTPSHPQRTGWFQLSSLVCAVFGRRGYLPSWPLAG